MTRSSGSAERSGDDVKRVAVISALPAVRAGLRSLIESDYAYRVIAEGSGANALADTGADVLVFDSEAGTDVADVAAAAAIAPALVILGTLAGDERLPQSLDRPFAYLPRDASREQLLAALAAVTQGLLVLDPRGGERLFASAGAAMREPPLAGSDQLTAREREVLQLVAEGLPNKTIARRLGISDHTVKFHVAALMNKLGAASRTEAVHLGARRGLISL